MSDCWGKVSRQRLMETIVILWTLTEVPGVSGVPISSQPIGGSQNSRQLTFEREKGLVEILAFLSGTTDDPSKVMAVCIEEGSAGDSMTVRLASNSGDRADVMSGFRRIATILEQSSKREKERDVASHDLLREIVRLDFWRILSRLRSSHAKNSRRTSGKPSLILQLSAAANSTLSGRGRNLSVEKVATLKEGVQNILTSVMTLEAIPDVSEVLINAQDLLMNMIECFSELANDDTLASLLNKVIDLDPGVKDHLKRAVGKLGQYYSASRDLVCAARTKRYSVFNKVFVEEYQLPQPPKSHLVRTPMTLEKSINDLIDREPTLEDRGLPMSVRDYLGSLYSAKSKNFKLWTANSRTSWKVHAEIKLLFFYELHIVDIPPRVICSSKSPCYLCHAFFDLHGRFHVPPTHGKLYPGWILPTWLCEISEGRQRDIGRVIDGLHAQLVLRIKKLVEKKRASVKPPNESILWTSAHWSASSLQSLLVSETSRRPAASNEKAQESEAVSEESEGYGISVKHQGSPSSSQDQVMKSAIDVDLLASDQPESKAGSSATIWHFLNPGETANMQLADARVELRISTSRLKLTFTGESLCNDSAPKAWWVRCRLIDTPELLQPSSPQPFDVTSIAPGSEVTLETGLVNNTRYLLVAACEEVLSIKYSTQEMVDTPDMSLDGSMAVI